MQKVRVLAVLAAITAAPAAYAGTINVPADYPTIQQAIDAATTGDLVLVAKGTFVENIDFKGKAITVQGAGHRPPNNTPYTLIDGSNGGPCCTMASGETLASVLMDIELRYGTGKLVNGKRLGGGVYITKSSSPTFDDVGVGFNTADLGAGMFIDKNCNPLIIDSLIANNVTANKGTGGGVYVLGTPTFDNDRIAENTATNGTGGGVYLQNTTTSITNSEIDKNHSWYGGGVHINGGAPLIADNLFEENEVVTAPINGEGGGLGIVGKSTALVINNEFRLNSAHSGGGIYAYDASPNIVTNLIHDNTAAQTSSGFGYGGGLAVGKTGGSLQLNQVYYNKGQFGGGMAARASTTMYVYDNILDHNDAAPTGGGVGGGLYSKDSSEYLLANTIVFNRADNGGGIYNSAGKAAPTVDTTIVFFNGANSNASFFDGTSNILFQFCDVEAASVGGTSLSVDPAFVDPVNRNYDLGSSSPVVDAGNFTFFGTPQDIYGDVRVKNGRVDMGAAEQ